MREFRGYTLVELMLSLLLAAVLLAFGWYGYGALVVGAQSADAYASLHRDLLIAQREALVRNRNVVLCPSRGGEDCDDATAWEHGWMGFVDENQDRARQAGEAFVFRQGELRGKPHLRTSTGRRALSVQAHGGAQAGSNVTFVLCDTRGPGKARALIVDNRGQLRRGVPSAARLATDCP